MDTNVCWKVEENCALPCLLFEKLFDEMVDGVYLLDPETSNILEVNRAGCESLGMLKEDVLGHSVLSLQKDVIGPEQWGQIAEVIRTSSPYTFIGRHQRKDGSEFPVEVCTKTFELSGKEYFISSARDITNRVSSDKDLANRKDSLWYALNESSDGLWDWNITNDDVYFSPKLKQMLGYGPDEMKPGLDTWKNSIHSDDIDRVIGILQDHLEGRLEKYEAIYRLQNRNGHYLWVHDRGKVSERDPDGTPLRAVGMVQDITDQKKMQEQLELYATHDELTGIQNRREGKRHLQELIDTSRISGGSFALCLLDIDYFKKVNDEHGHNVGDQVLKEFVNNVQEKLRPSDKLYRWGGEEFVILFPNMTHENMGLVGEKVRVCVDETPIVLEEDILIALTVSLGMVNYPQDGLTYSELIQKADRALYRAKGRGRNCVEIYDLDSNSASN